MRHYHHGRNEHPAVPEGWERVKAAFAALRKDGYAARGGVEPGAIMGSKGCVYYGTSERRSAEECGVLYLNFGATQEADYANMALAAVGRAACAALTAAGALWWWDGEGYSAILVNVGAGPEEFRRAAELTAAQGRCSDARKAAHEAQAALAKALGMGVGYLPGATGWGSSDPSYYDAAAARYATEARALKAALDAYTATKGAA